MGGNGKHTRLTRIHATRHAWRVALRRRATQRITARLWAAGRPARAVLSRTPEPLTPPHPHPHPQRGEGVGEGVGRRWGLGGESGGWRVARLERARARAQHPPPNSALPPLTRLARPSPSRTPRQGGLGTWHGAWGWGWVVGQTGGLEQEQATGCESRRR